MTAVKVVVVSGLSGAGKASILRVFEDLGFDAVDNPPIPIVAALVARSDRPLAIGLDARSQGFDANAILQIIADLRARSEHAPELIYAQADEAVLLRRFTETRRRHPLAPQGRVLDGIVLETRLTRPLLERADWVVDTSGLALPTLRRNIEQRYQHSMGQDVERRRLTIAVISFAFPAGVPREADMVFDVRFLRNPHYIDDLREQTGLDTGVAEFIQTDPDFQRYFDAVLNVCKIVVPRFVSEGKKYATIAIGCTGGRHRSVYVANLLSERLTAYCNEISEAGDWSVLVSHRDLTQVVANSQPLDGAGRASNDVRSVSYLS